ncbi:MAG: hypothetical protein ACR2P2_08480 [Nakamurella sp.]
MNQDAQPPGRRRRAASRAAGPPIAAVDTPAATVDLGDQAAVTTGIPEPTTADPQWTEQLDTGRRRTRRQRSPRRSDDAEESGGGSVMPPDRSTSSRRTGEPVNEQRGDEHDGDEHDVDESVASHGVPAGRPRSDARRSDRGLRGLEASRSTQVSATAAMRAREYAAPTAEDLAEAERDVQLVRRKYVPPTPLQASRRRGRRRDPAD